MGEVRFTSYRNDQRPPEACKRYDQPSQPTPWVSGDYVAAFAGFRRIESSDATTNWTRLAALSGLGSGLYCVSCSMLYRVVSLQILQNHLIAVSV